MSRRLRTLAAAVAALALALAGTVLVASPAAALDFPVTNALDSGDGSLREAIQDANANPGLDTISINIPGAATIALLSTLEVTDSVAISVTGGTPPTLTHTGAFDVMFLNPAVSGMEFSITGPMTFDGSGFTGHGIYAVPDGDGVTIATIALTDVDFHDFDASSGAALHAETISEELTITDCVFEDNVTTGAGGAIFFAASAGVMVIDGTRFEENESADQGGAIASVQADDMFISDSEFIRNEAAGDGGAIWRAAGSDVVISGSTFADNRSAESGGTIAMYSANDLVITDDTHFTYEGEDPSADESGGFIAVELSGDVTMDRLVTFTGGWAESGNGGALWVVDSGEVTLNDTQWIENDANADFGAGGAISVSASTSFSLTRSLVSRNAAHYGGGIYLSGLSEDSDIRFSSIVGNTAAGGQPGVGWGGGLYAEIIEVPFTIEGSTFEGNEAQGGTSLGGGAFFDTIYAATTIRDTTFSGNAVGGDSGISLYIEEIANTSTLDIVNSTFDETDGETTPMIGFELVEAGSVTVLAHNTFVGNVALYVMGSAEGSVLVTHGAFQTTLDPIITDEGYQVPVQWSMFTQPLDSDYIDDLGDNTFSLASLMLGPLQGNGIVLPKTRLPQPGSPLIDTGDPAVVDAPPFDERGPGFTRIVRVIDIGATEVQLPEHPVTGGPLPLWTMVLAAGLLVGGFVTMALARPRGGSRR